MLPAGKLSKRGMLNHCLLWLALSVTGAAQTLQLDSGLVTHNDTLKGVLELTSPLSGKAELVLTWTDSYGRTVAVQSQKILGVRASRPRITSTETECGGDVCSRK
jgi:hypothetical protein